MKDARPRHRADSGTRERHVARHRDLIGVERRVSGRLTAPAGPDVGPRALQQLAGEMSTSTRTSRTSALMGALLGLGDPLARARAALLGEFLELVSGLLDALNAKPGAGALDLVSGLHEAVLGLLEALLLRRRFRLV